MKEAVEPLSAIDSTLAILFYATTPLPAV